MSSEASSSAPSSSKPRGFLSLLSTIRRAKSRLQNERPRTPVAVHPSPPSSSHILPPPEDITSHLASDIGLEFKVARKVSQAYVDKAVELQFLSERRASSTHKKLIRNARSSKVVSNISSLQSKLLDSQKRFFKRDIKSLLNQAADMARTLYPNRASEADDTEEEEEPSPIETRADAFEDSDDELDGESIGSPVNAEDEQALQEMSARSSFILAKMYDKGHMLPKRHEKIKLAEATGLTYRQVGIWYSNRRERNRPDRKNKFEFSSSYAGSPPPSESRESSAEAVSTSSERESTSPLVKTHAGFDERYSDEDMMSPEREYDGYDEDDDGAETEVEDEADSPAGRDCSRVTSFATTVSATETLVSNGSNSDWAPMFSSSFVDIPAAVSGGARTFDFSTPTETPCEPSSTAPISLGFPDLPFVQRSSPDYRDPHAIAAYEAGFRAAVAERAAHPRPAPSQSFWQTSPQTSPQTSSDDCHYSPASDSSRDSPILTRMEYTPYPPPMHNVREERPSKRTRLDRRPTPPLSTKPRLQQRRMAITPLSPPSYRRIARSPPSLGLPQIAPRPQPTQYDLAPSPVLHTRGVKRSASSQELSESPTSPMDPYHGMTFRIVKPLPRPVMANHPNFRFPPTQPTIAMQ